jgi:outer membrane biosynthesis protein TonB
MEMLAKAWQQLRERPFAGVAVSLAIHLAILAVLLWVGGPSSIYTVKRGEPLFVELPQADESAQRGAPPAEQKPAPPAPRVQPAPPAPRVAASPPKPASPPSRPETRAPERPTPATTPPAAPEAPSGELPRVASAPPKAAETPPPQSEPARAPEPPREATPPSPAPPRVAAVPESAPAPDIRKALRRGPGPVGAGGRGEGWSGIEGEPIPLDSTDPKFNDYLDRIRRMIKEKWGYPCIKDLATGHCDYKSARLVIVFGILKDGRVPMLEVAQQSGYDVYDDYAVNAIKLASPFPPVPASLMATAKSGSAGVKIVAAFQYVLVESSLTNILR